MAKRGPIGKVESFYIENKINEYSIEEIALDLDRSISSVEKFIKKNKINQTKQMSPVGQQFARSKGTVVMTENASSMSDHTRALPNNRDRSCTTNIK